MYLNTNLIASCFYLFKVKKLYKISIHTHKTWWGFFMFLPSRVLFHPWLKLNSSWPSYQQQLMGRLRWRSVGCRCVIPLFTLSLNIYLSALHCSLSPPVVNLTWSDVLFGYMQANVEGTSGSIDSRRRPMTACLCFSLWSLACKMGVHPSSMFVFLNFRLEFVKLFINVFASVLFTFAFVMPAFTLHREMCQVYPCLH